MGSFIQFTLESGIARITLNRPEVLNSFNQQMAAELRESLQGAATDAAVRAVLLTGAGRAFCAGQDLSEVTPKPGETPDLGRIVRDCYNPILQLIRNTEKPFVCAVNGVAAGAGANLALACDIVLAAKEASFIQSFSKVGLIPDSGGTYTLPRLVGLARATALMFLGDKISAETAVQYGMIYRMCDGAKLLEEATTIATQLATMPTRGLGLTKRGVNQSFRNDFDAQLLLEEELQREAGRTHDYQEGVAAFLAKRKPVFQGK